MAEFYMPSLGADMVTGILVAWRVKPGDRVTRGDIIAEVETDKGLIDVEVFEDGVVDQLLVQPSDEKIPVGTL
ncbi:MAG TPA: 2-oxo acid dehydrogenase subunit E2, partial [Chloroflexi bacterium]|nr:2-oxo acid dehydrogenase subunit E2 [Chloroflexota bacterium]